MAERAREIYEFGPFRLDVGERQLVREGQPVRLRAKIFDTLRVLVEHPGHLVGKDELLSAVWPDTVVEENNLATNITALRKTLGDAYIETIPRQGYRFLVEVRRVEMPPGAVITAPPVPQETAAVILRETELEQLRGHLQEAAAGRRQVVCVSGDAGIGKTTLVESFLSQVQPFEGVRVARGQCLEFRGEGEAYMPLFEALGRLAREYGDELVPVLQRHAPTWLAEMPSLVRPEEFETLRQQVLGATRDRMLREMMEALEAFTASTPLVLVLEDLHWSDHSTLDFLSMLARRGEPARLLLIGTYRPADLDACSLLLHGLTQELKLRGQCSEIRVGQLDEKAIAEYLAAKLPGALLPEGLPALAYQRTGGNPLFLGALLDHWKSQGSVTQNGEGWRVSASLDDMTSGVPESLQNLIERQLQRLDHFDQQVVEAAAVAGREFCAAAVAAALEQDEERVESRCELMARQGQFLLSRATTEWPDGTVAASYTFRHDLYQEALYSRLPAGRRTRLHQRIGLRLESAHGGRSAEIAGELASHFIRGREPWLATRYLLHASENAWRRSAQREAVIHTRQALDLLKQVPESPERMDREFRLRLLLATSVVAVNGWADPCAESSLHKARALAEQLGEPRRLYPVLFTLAMVYELRGEYPKAQQLLEERLQLPRQPNDTTLVLDSDTLLACSTFHQGQFERALEHAQHGLSIYNPREHLTMFATYGENPCVACEDWAALALWFLGYPDQAVKKAHRALQLAQQPGYLYSLTTAQAQAACLYQFRREPEATQHWAETTIRVATEQGFPYNTATGLVLQGWAMAVQGQHAEGLSFLETGLAACRAIGAEMDRPYFLALKAGALATARRTQEALEAIAEGQSIVRNSRSFFWEAELYRLKGALLPDNPVEAEACFRHALEVARKQGAKSLELRTAVNLAQLWQQRGRPEEGSRLLSPLYAAFTEGLETPDLLVARKLLVELDGLGRSAAAS